MIISLHEIELAHELAPAIGVREIVSIKIGYACLTVGVSHTQFRTCSLKNTSAALLEELVHSNLTALGHMLDYNSEHRIQLLRISSDIIPFASHAEVDFPWVQIFQEELALLGEKAREAGIRLSMHPGQYTVLNSPSAEVVTRAVADLEYHCSFLDALGMGPDCKIILHVGGAYGDKEAAIARFKENYRLLNPSIKNRLVIENDDKIYSISEVLEIGLACEIPVVFDNLHHEVYPAQESKSEVEWIALCAETWRESGGPQKIHYSQQAQGKRAGSHSATIAVRTFVEFASRLPDGCNVMLEVKDKNLSAVKCILATAQPGKIQDLEKEWARYKYAVLERSPRNYQAIRSLLKDKSTYPVLEFYDLIEEAIAAEPEPGKAENAALHVWGYFKDRATEAEKRRFDSLLERYLDKRGTLRSVKNHLLKLAVKYGDEYLLSSLYFYEV